MRHPARADALSTAGTAKENDCTEVSANIRSEPHLEPPANPVSAIQFLKSIIPKMVSFVRRSGSGILTAIIADVYTVHSGELRGRKFATTGIAGQSTS